MISVAKSNVGGIEIEIARGSALACAAIQDVLVVGKALDETESQSRKMELDRMAAMLSRLGGRGCQVRENQTIYGDQRHDFDPDIDSDLDQDAKEPRSNLARNPPIAQAQASLLSKTQG